MHNYFEAHKVKDLEIKLEKYKFEYIKHKLNAKKIANPLNKS